MPQRSVVSSHYTHGHLLQSIRDALQKLGKAPESVGVDDLGPADEFHIGGRTATERFLDQLDIGKTHQVLDVGCGLGGSARFAAQKYGCRITGVDVTQEYVDVGNTLCEWVGMTRQIRLGLADATALPHASSTFDRVYMMHVGMNIKDKRSLASELHRVVRPAGIVGIYDIMRINAGELTFPVPWASDAAGSSVSAPGVYKSVLQAAGFKVVAEHSRRDFALEFFKNVQAKAAKKGGPPPLGLQIIMGEAAPAKLKNMIENISRELIAPVEIIAEKTA